MIVVTACFRAETAWIPRLRGVRTIRAPMGEKACGALNRVLNRFETPRLIVSTGFCGGLSPRLRPGVLVLAERICYHGEVIVVDAKLIERAKEGLSQAKLDYVTGPIKTSEQVIQNPLEKQHLWKQGSIAVDMESGPLAQVARERGIGFLSLKAVLDPADRTLPFTTGRSLACSVLFHPLTTLWLSWLSYVAGRAIGRAVPVATSVLAKGEG